MERSKQRIEIEVNGKKCWFDLEEFKAYKEFMWQQEVRMMPEWLRIFFGIKEKHEGEE